MPPATSTTPASANTCSPALRQERQVAGHEVRRHQPAVHREAAEVGDRDGVDVAVADLGDRAEAERDLARQHRQQVGDGDRDEEDGRGTRAPRRPQPSSTISAPSGSTTSLSRSSGSTP